MGQSTNGILFYGYVWTDEERRPWEPRWDEEDPRSEAEQERDQDEDEDDRWLRICGFAEDPPTDYDASTFSARRVAYRERRNAVLLLKPAKLVMHCCTDTTMYGIAAIGTVKTALRGSVVSIDPTELTVQPEWASQLANYVARMDVRLNLGQEPGWHLVSWWS